ncbi:lipoyl(octanoyl) transferase LipB [Psychrobacter ciconiae]|uniref:lipoyl(octanoyl) transferase LipB n=1 Tax=Psychrobacter ciconiae TaxID=1553449 RepID=UPI00191930F5|nr:lipoyl(octanoyl) transferase LipB [Psychrobacter ciconiae]
MSDFSSIDDYLIQKSLIKADYNPTHDAMLARTLERIALKKEQAIRSPDELWVVDHNDVYTLGQAGKEDHILQKTATPIIKTDRGGQVTWHGHGQLVVYWLFDLPSLDWSVRNLVSHAEQAIEDVVNDCIAQNPLQKSQTITAKARRDAPGVYLYSLVDDEEIMLGKIASLGFKIKHGFSYHGIALNLDCDLSAFNAINPCGYAGMQMLRLADFVKMDDKLSFDSVTQKLIDNIARRHRGDIKLRPISDS